MKKVLVFGTFDIIHKGHRDFFRQAKEHGDYLVVILSRDQTVLQVKSRVPKYPEQERRSQLEALPEIDEVVLGSLGNKYLAILDIKPDVVALGYDQVAFTGRLPEFLDKNEVNVEIVRLEPFNETKYKSSIIRRI